MKTSKFITLLSIAAMICAMSVSGIAEEKKKRGPHIEGGESGIEFMTKFDVNKDGKIDHGEWEAVKIGTVYREKHWPEYNPNRDKFITLDEVPDKDAGPSEPAPKEKTEPTAAQIAFIVKFDKDQDGKLSKKEYTGLYFSVYDRNGDGFIEAMEAPEQKKQGY